MGESITLPAKLAIHVSFMFILLGEYAASPTRHWIAPDLKLFLRLNT